MQPVYKAVFHIVISDDFIYKNAICQYDDIRVKIRCMLACRKIFDIIK